MRNFLGFLFAGHHFSELVQRILSNWQFDLPVIQNLIFVVLERHLLAAFLQKRMPFVIVLLYSILLFHSHRD